jgi:hypothetical protein
MKIVLTLPEWRIENPYPPLGVAYIGAVLEKSGYIVKIFIITLCVCCTTWNYSVD